jgi:hypothetical protein
MMFWLQPGGQSIGDQVFNAFAYWEQKEEYVTSWRLYEDRPIIYKLAIWPAIVLTIIGFAAQFVGLRGLHGSVTLYQLAATLCMAIIRAVLRSKRLDEKQNRLQDQGRNVEGHELDWNALQLEASLNGESGRSIISKMVNELPLMVSQMI